ncbi:MAG: nickel pincer cofactor biosynthesis protein LarB [Caldilineaceae bacterium]
MMDQQQLEALLTAVADGSCNVAGAVERLRLLPFEALADVTIDHHRALRWGFPEVIFGGGKTPRQVADIFARLSELHPRVLATRITVDHYQALQPLVPDAQFQEAACCLWLDREPERERHDGVVVVAAGTSDLPVVEEACLTLDLMGHRPHRIIDVGVAGLHRLVPHIPVIQRANVVVVCAGMEGALASVIGGLTDAPVIAAPTSVGYGASLGGITALLAMLNSCASGVSVVNIDNGYGAGHQAALINSRIIGKS